MGGAFTAIKITCGSEGEIVCHLSPTEDDQFSFIGLDINESTECGSGGVGRRDKASSHISVAAVLGKKCPSKDLRTFLFEGFAGKFGIFVPSETYEETSSPVTVN